MYFESRTSAGQLLAQKMFDAYRYEDCAVVSISDASILVGEEIAKELHCVLTLLLSEDIDVPGEGLIYGSVAQTGAFTYNGMLSTGERDGYTSEYHGYFAEQKRVAFQKMNRLIGDGGTITPDLLRERNIVIVSDGFRTGGELDTVLDFLKPIRHKKIVAVAPVATIPAVDRLHVTVDDIYILDVKENYISTNHYYDDNDIPNREESIQKINDIIVKWQ